MAATLNVTAQAMAMVLAPPPKQGYSQAQADVVANYRGFGQTQTHVVKFAKQNSFAQSQARIKAIYMASAQAQCFITI